MVSHSGDAEPATVCELSVSGMVIDTNRAVEAGARISLVIEAPSSEGALRLWGHAVSSRRIEDIGEGELYCVEVSFDQSEERRSSSVAAVVNTLVSEAATTDRPARKREGVHLSGSLSEVGVASLLAFLELERSSGVLAIERDSSKLSVFVRDGSVVDVESDLPDSSPIDVLADLLGWPEGAFEFSFQAVERDDVIDRPTTGLLMECARISDERSR